MPPVTVTVTESDADPPPAPVQVSVYVAVEVRVPVDCEPFVGFVPLHPPLAMQDTASVVDHVSVDDWPLIIEAGFAERLTVGGGDPPVTCIFLIFPAAIEA